MNQKIFFFYRYLCCPLQRNPLRYNTLMSVFFPILEALLISIYWYNIEIFQRCNLYLLNYCEYPSFDGSILFWKEKSSLLVTTLLNKSRSSLTSFNVMFLPIKIKQFRNILRYVPKTSIQITWHNLNEMLTSSASSLIFIRRSIFSTSLIESIIDFYH